MATKGAAKGATKNAGFGVKGGMAAGPHKPTAPSIKSDQVAKPPKYSTDIRGVSATGPKAQPMYTGKASKLGKTTVQLDKASRSGSGIMNDNGKGYESNMPDRKRGSGRPV